jgi:trans-4-hydroxy-L-proline dehydratase
MTMTARVQRLRQGSLDAVPSLSAERAQLITAFYRSTERSTLSAAARRAQAFAYLMEHKTVCILPGELIVGEKGPAPKAAPTYPELCCHSLDDLDILDRRDKIPFRVSPEVRQVYAEQIIPYWQGHSMRERIFAEMTPQWLDAYEAGIYTEFMEQRAPGHTVLDDKIYRRGMLDFIAEIEAARASLDYLEDPQAYARSEQLKAMALCARAIIRFAERHAEQAEALAKSEPHPARRQRVGADRGGLPPGAGPRPAHLLGGAAGLLVRAPGRDQRAQHLGRLLPRQARPAPAPVLPPGAAGRVAFARPGGGAAAALLDQVQQPAGAAQGRRDGR